MRLQKRLRRLAGSQARKPARRLTRLEAKFLAYQKFCTKLAGEKGLYPPVPKDTALCGNGMLDPGEVCDDGGLCTGDYETPCASNAGCATVGGSCLPMDGDGCSHTCRHTNMLSTQLGQVAYWSDPVFNDLIKQTSSGGNMALLDEFGWFKPGISGRATFLMLALLYWGHGGPYGSVHTTNAPRLPVGNYTLSYQGSGSINVVNSRIDATRTFSAPGVFSVPITNWGQGGGNYVEIVNYDPANPPQEVKLLMPGYSADESQNPYGPFFTPFVEKLKDFSHFRFGPWQATMSTSNLVHWDERITPQQRSQDWSIGRQGDIVSITNTNSTPFSGNWVARVQTAQPHGLTTGQLVELAGTGAKLIYLDSAGAQQEYKLDRIAGYNMIEVIDDTHFNVSIPGYWDKYRIGPNETWMQFVPANGGLWKLSVETGVALEYMIQLSNYAHIDPWFVMPLLANDDYIRQFARMLKQKLEPGRKVYIEYANEVWNYAQPQFYLAGKGREMGYTSSAEKAIQAAYARRAAQIFCIFRAEGFSEGQLQTIIASQAAWPARGEGYVKAFFDKTINPNTCNAKLDYYAIAPYFSNATHPAASTDGPDEIIDKINLTLEDHYFPIWQQDQQIADKYGVKLITYEAGLGSGQEGFYGDPDLNVAFEVARSPRVKDTLKRAYAFWKRATKEACFDVFVLSGVASKYGYWGHMEYLDQRPYQTDADGSRPYKYEAMLEIARAYVGDGKPEPWEGCDDGNMVSGDGCGSKGQIEPGYTCAGEPSVCRAG